MGVRLEEADGYDDLDHSINRGDAGDPFPGSAGTTEFTSTTYPGSDAHRGDSPCTVGVRSIRMRGSTASFAVTPAERLKVLGDADGSLSVDENDVYEAYWYALGWLRPGSAIQVDNADVDGDGDVDIRDGFLIDAFQSGYRVPVEGMGVSELVVCEGGAGRAVVGVGEVELGGVEGAEQQRLPVRSVGGQHDADGELGGFGRVSHLESFRLRSANRIWGSLTAGQALVVKEKHSLVSEHLLLTTVLPATGVSAFVAPVPLTSTTRLALALLGHLTHFVFSLEVAGTPVRVLRAYRSPLPPHCRLHRNLADPRPPRRPESATASPTLCVT